MTSDQAMALLSALIESNERYLARRRHRGHTGDIDALLLQARPALVLVVHWLQQGALEPEA